MITEVINVSSASDIEENLKTMTTAMFAKLEMVTREEFDAQAQELIRSRERFGALEARLVQLDMCGAGRGQRRLMPAREQPE